MTKPDNAGPQGGNDGGNGGAGNGTNDNPNPQPPDNGGNGKQDPPWGKDSDFDPQRAWSLIQNLRSESAAAKKDRDSYKGKVDEFENANKTEGEKLTADRDSYKGRAEQAEAKLLRLEVGAAKGLTQRQALRLTGSSKEELEADADALLEDFKPSGSAANHAPNTRPKERYNASGSDPGEAPAEMDPAKLADSIRASRRF